jgi:hypothetical protein
VQKGIAAVETRYTSIIIHSDVTCTKSLSGARSAKGLINLAIIFITRLLPNAEVKNVKRVLPFYNKPAVRHIAK